MNGPTKVGDRVRHPDYDLVGQVMGFETDSQGSVLCSVWFNRWTWRTLFAGNLDVVR